MESNSCATGPHMSGNMMADCTLLISDIFGLFPSSFSRLIPMLEARYRIINYDDNGFDVFNRARHPRHQNIEGYAEDLLRFLREKRIENVTYLAHSVNALLAFQAALKEPGLFDKIILLSAIPCLGSNLATLYGCGTGSSFDTNTLFDNVMRVPDAAAEEQLPDRLRQIFSGYSADKSRQIFDILTTADYRPQLNEINVPVMILQGTGDKVATGEVAYLMHRHLPESYLVKIRAKGHLPQLSEPEEICKAMEIFMYPAVC